MKNSRRKFMATSVGGTLAAAGAMGGSSAKPENSVTKVDKRPFGKTGADVSIYGLGLGSAFVVALKDNTEEIERLLTRALDLGINYWDTARLYERDIDGVKYISEQMLGPMVEKRRDDIYLVSKTMVRDYDGFMRDLEYSLSNLKTDHIDLYHIHNLSPKARKDREPDTVQILEKGAARAAMKAKEEGIISHFGVTGHSGPQILIDCINAFDPDALLTIFPANRPDEGRYEDELLPLAVEKNMGVVGMKVFKHVRNADLSPDEMLGYALSLPGVASTIVGTGSIEHLDSNARIATNFKSMDQQKRKALTEQVVASIPAGLPQPWDLPGYEDCAIA